MKSKLYIFFVFLVASFSLSGQNYFPKGAIWHYSNTIYTFPVNYTYTTIESKGDSIFNNDTLTYVEGYVSCGAGYNELVKQVGQKVYKLNLCDSSFSLLYDFSASVGDTLTFFPNLCFNSDSAKIVIDSIKPININGYILNHFYFSQLTPISYWAMSYLSVGEYIEGIGNLHSFYPYYGPCDPWGDYCVAIMTR